MYNPEPLKFKMTWDFEGTSQDPLIEDLEEVLAKHGYVFIKDKGGTSCHYMTDTYYYVKVKEPRNS